jgi:hypothetical protein
MDRKQRFASLREKDMRILTPERQKLKEQAISLRYDYGLTERQIADQLNLAKTTIHDYMVGHTRSKVYGNNGHIKLLEGNCLELIPTLPDKSIDCLLTDPPYSVMADYEWDKKDNASLGDKNMRLWTFEYWEIKLRAPRWAIAGLSFCCFLAGFVIAKMVS